MNFQDFASLVNEPNKIYLQVLYAQARLESANFTSGLYINHKNVFGMKRAYGRVQVGYLGEWTAPNGERFVIFSSHSNSLLDRINWDRQKGVEPPTSTADVERYVKAIQTGKMFFATDPNYINKVLAIYEQEFGDLGDQIDMSRQGYTMPKVAKFGLLGMLAFVGIGAAFLPKIKKLFK